jgi:hypothetical protein
MKRFPFWMLIAVASPADAAAQRQIDVASTPSCRDCRIRLTPRPPITDVAGRAALASPNTLTLDEHGNTIVVSTAAPYQLSVFGPDSKLTRIAGQEGDGPGEFRTIGALVARADTLHVFDSALNRWTRLDRDFRVVSTVQLPAYAMNAVFWDRNLVVNSNIGTPDLAGYPLHVLSEDGSVVRSLGYYGGPYRVDMPYSGLRVLAACPNGTLWFATVTRYELTGVSHNAAETILRRNAAWFEPHSSRPLYTEEGGPPPPMLQALYCDDESRLWTLTHVADPKWRSAGLRPANRDYHRSGWEQRFQRDRYYDTIIEVIDSRRGRVIAAARTDRYIEYILPGGTMGAYREVDGAPSLLMWNVRLVNPK